MIAFLGTGLLGSAMVEALLERGLEVTVYNRTEDKARPLAGKGARLAGSPAEAVRGAERVHLCLADDAVVDALIEALLPSLGEGTAVVDHSTTSPAGTAARAARLASRGVRFLHAPVFMSPGNARLRRGLMLASGPKALFDSLEPELAPMTGKLLYAGERPDLAACQKLFGNAMIFAVVGGLSDVLAMARGAEVSPEQAMQLFAHFNPAMVLEYRGVKMAAGDFTASFEMTMALKDARLMLEMAEGANVPLAVLPGIAARMDAEIAGGHGSDDMGAIARPAVEKSR